MTILQYCYVALGILLCNLHGKKDYKKGQAVPQRKQRLDSAKDAELAVWFNARLHQRTFDHGRKTTKSCESGQQTSDQKRRRMMIMIMMNHRYRNH